MHSENTSSHKLESFSANQNAAIVDNIGNMKLSESSCSMLSPGRVPLKNQASSSSLLKSPAVRSLASPTKSLLNTPTRILPTSPKTDTAALRRSPRLLSRLIQGMDINTNARNTVQDMSSPNPFVDLGAFPSKKESSAKITNFDTIISSSPQKQKSFISQPDANARPNGVVEIPLLLPTGKTPRATRSISFPSSEEDEKEDDQGGVCGENSLNLSNTIELFSPGFHGEIVHHAHGVMSSFDSQSLVDKISNEFAEPSACELEFYQSEEYADGISFVASLPHVSNLPAHPFHGSSPVLPSIPVDGKAKITLVLDLDETLPMSPFDISFNLCIPGRALPLEVYVRWRPHLFSFLEELKHRSDVIDVVLFTASQKIYARRVLSLMDPDGSIFSHSLFRESCRFLEGSFVKDLSILGRPLSHTILVDNSIQAYALHPENGYAIPSWFDDPKDNELPRLLSFLDNLLSRTAAFPEQVDFRHIIRKRFPIYNSTIALKETKRSDVSSVKLENAVQIMV
ncbi:hypothetical protein MDAP_000024 [Mitosporidium daphniae]